MRSAGVTAIGGVILLAGVGWQAYEIHRLSRAHAALEEQVATLSAQVAPLALAAETRGENPPAPSTQTPSEMDAPAGPAGVLIEAPLDPSAPPPTTDETGGQVEAAPAVSPCRATCERVIDCALSACGLGTTGTDPLFAACEAGCGDDETLRAAVDGATACAGVITVARRLPAFAAACSAR